MFEHKFQPSENVRVVPGFKNAHGCSYQFVWITFKVIHHSVLTINVLVFQDDRPRFIEVGIIVIGGGLFGTI
jgi:hypothetical protein